MTKSEHTKNPEQALIKDMREGMDSWLARISPSLKTPDLLEAIEKIRGWIDDWELKLNAKSGDGMESQEQQGKGGIAL